MVIDTKMLRVKLQKDKDKLENGWGRDQFDCGISYECRQLLEWLNELEGVDDDEQSGL